MKILGGVIGAILLIVVGVGGTLGVQRVTGGESADCKTMNNEVKLWVTAWEKKTTPATLDQLSIGDKLMDVRYKACRR